MDAARKQEIAARLDSVIHTLETSDSEDDLARASRELSAVWPDLMESIPLVGTLVKNVVPRGQADIDDMSPDEVREKLLPSLKQFRDFLVGRQNAPTKPGCSGGTGALLLVVMAAAAFLQHLAG